MKEFLIDLLKSAGAVILSVVALIVLILIGAAAIGYGAVKEWQWMINGGVFLVALGLIFLLRGWWTDD